jgi:electron transfer flavoprotein alpha subunit
MTQKTIWIFGDLRTVRHWKASCKVMAKGLTLARDADARIAVVLLGAGQTNASLSEKIDLAACVSMADAARQSLALGAEAVYCLQHPNLVIPRPDVYAKILADFVAQHKPWLILFTLNDFGRETAAMGAQHCQAGMIADCTELAYQNNQVVGRCPAWGGQVLADITLADGWDTAFVTVQPHGATLPETGPVTEDRIVTIPLREVQLPSGMQMLERTMNVDAGQRLEDAPIVVAGGAGLGDARGFGLIRELSAAMGGEIGATRPAVLYHWADEDRLIGQTGKTIRPKLLITVGTSGAIQYTAGISDAKTIVAINRDPMAPIFQVADIGIVGDAQVLLPMIIQWAQQSAMRRLADAACALDNSGDVPKDGFGDLVRQLRQARDWSEAELAQHTNQTPEFIHQVETNQLSPSVSFILRMAQAMQVDPSTFLGKEERASIRDRRAQAYYQRTQQYSYATLTPGAENSHLRAFMITIEPHQAHKPVAYKHDGEEFIYVMEGDLELTLGAKVRKFKSGESVHFNSDVPHKLKSLSSDPTRCLVVLYTI